MAELDAALIFTGLLVGLLGGAAGGTLAGLAGVGGGLVYVPLFILFMPQHEAGLSLQVFASLVAVVATGFFSSRAHLRLGHIDRSLFLLLIPGLMIGAAIGLWSTLMLAPVAILLSLAFLNGWIAFDYRRSGSELQQHGNRGVAAPISGVIGYLSGMLGIGGGTMLVPLLRRFVALRFAVGTSALCGLTMAAGALLLNLLFESRWPELVGQQWQFIVPAWIAIAAMLPFGTAWSAALHRRLQESELRFAMRLLFILLACGYLLAALSQL